MPVEENPNKDLVKEETVEQQSAQIEVVENTTENQNRDPEKQPNDATDKVNERVETNNEKSEDKLESTKNMGGTNEDITKGRELISPVLKKMEDLKNEMAQKFSEVAKKYETTITSGAGLDALAKLKLKRQADAEKLQAEGELNKVKTEEESKLALEREGEVKAENAEKKKQELELAKAEIVNFDAYNTELNGLKSQRDEIEELLKTTGDPDVEAIRGDLNSQNIELNDKINELSEKVLNLKRLKDKIKEKEKSKEDLYKKGTIHNFMSGGNLIEAEIISDVKTTEGANPKEYVKVKATKGNLETEIFIKDLIQTENLVPVPENKSTEKSNGTYSEIGQKILAGPRKILSTMSPEEVKAFSAQYPNEKAYLEDTLRDLNKFNGENGSIVYENLKKYINFLEKARGTNYSNEVLSFAEVQALRKQQEDLLNNKAENPVPVPPVPENKGKNMEKSAEQIELEKLKLELQEKNKKHQENYNQRESTIKLIEEIKNKKGYTEELKNLNKKVIPYESVLAAVLPDKKSGLDNLQKLLSSTEDAKDKERIQKLIDKVQSIPEEDVKNLAQNLSYNSYGISTASFSRMDTFKHEDLGKLLSNPSIDTAISNASFTHKRVSEFEDKIAKDPEIIEQQNKLSELVKQNEVDYKEVRRVEREIEKLEVNL